MFKKLVLLASAIAALAALLAPAAANATPVLTSKLNPGVPIPPGTAITGTANNSTLRLTTETALGILECESVMLNAEVIENSGTSVKGKGTEGSTTEGCSFEGVEELEITNVVINDLATNMVEGETGTGTFHLAYGAKLPGGAECKFSNIGKTAGVFHYTLGSDILHITPTNITSSGCGEAFLEGTVALETPNGTAITFS